MIAVVIQYNRKTRDSVVKEFPGAGGHRDALILRVELEASRTDPNIEIASLVSDSLDTIRHTHSRYFPDLAPAAP